MRFRIGDVALGLALATSACVSVVHGPKADVPGRTDGAPPGTVTSNVERRDYAGSAACLPCHEDLVRGFERAPMHGMTRDARTATFRSSWNGATFRFKGESAELVTKDSARFMILRSDVDGTSARPRIYRVTKVIGGRVREDFAGVPVAVLDANAPSLGAEGEEVVLPVTYFFATGELRYKGYSVMVDERPVLRAGPVWNKTCVFCHNTVPLLGDMYGALGTGKVPPYQGEVVDALLPPARRAVTKVTDATAFGEAVGREMKVLGAELRDRPSDLPEFVVGAITATRGRFDGRHTIETGIGCEACHGGSKEHVVSPTTLPTFEPRAPYFTTTRAGKPVPRAEAVNRACARCHQVLFSGYPDTWEGGHRRVNPGGSFVNSGEARDFLLGGCSSSMSCAACHEPHAASDGARVRALDGPSGDRVCLGCHSKYGAAEARKAHTHHAAGSAGDACVSCHMPRKNMSLDNGLTRYHRIGSPTDPERVAFDRPLECALCHMEASVASLVATMETWWSKSYDRERLRELYGDLEGRPLLRTLERGKDHEKAVALAVLGEAKDARAWDLVVGELANRRPLVRYYAKRAASAILGAPVDVDVNADGETLARAIRDQRKVIPPRAKTAATQGSSSKTSK
ncbi:MAG: cytochrome c3 family protein [Polyangiaceae bacterium]